MQKPDVVVTSINVIKNHTWVWQGQEVKLQHMNMGQLESCLKFVNNTKTNREIFKYPKEYWLHALKHMIRFRSGSNVTQLITNIEQKRIKRASNFVDDFLMFKRIDNNKLTLNKQRTKNVL